MRYVSLRQIYDEDILNSIANKYGYNITLKDSNININFSEEAFNHEDIFYRPIVGAYQDVFGGYKMCNTPKIYRFALRFFGYRNQSDKHIEDLICDNISRAKKMVDELNEYIDATNKDMMDKKLREDAADIKNISVKFEFDFDADVSDLDEKYVDKKGLARDLALEELKNMILNDEITGEDFEICE